MNIVKGLRLVTKPRWDGSRVLFEIEVAGRPVACAISRAALQELNGCRYIASGEVLRRFADGRHRIEEIATNIFAVRPESVTGTLHVWADDINDPPSATAVAHQALQFGPGPAGGEASMDDESRADQVREARAAYAARREAFRRAATPPGKDGSPQALEATLASISEEVTADAIERRRDKGKPR